MNSDGKEQISPHPSSIPDGSWALGRSAIPSENLIAVLAVPTLLGLAGAKALVEAIATKISPASEEVFRGARLPVLRFPTEIPTEEPAAKGLRSRMKEAGRRD